VPKVVVDATLIRLRKIPRSKKQPYFGKATQNRLAEFRLVLEQKKKSRLKKPILVALVSESEIYLPGIIFERISNLMIGIV